MVFAVYRKGSIVTMTSRIKRRLLIQRRKYLSIERAANVHMEQFIVTH